MKKIVKVLMLLFLISIFVGSIITVIVNNKKSKKMEEEISSKQNVSYKVKRKNNKYSISNSEGKLLNKTLQDVIYTGKNIYLYLSEESNATILKYNFEKDETKIIFEENPEIVGGIKRLGNYYIINNYIYDKNFKKISSYEVNENEMLYPNLQYKLISKDDKIIKLNIENNEEEELLHNGDNKTYSLFLISSNSKLILFKENSEDNQNLVYLDKDGNVTKINIKYKEEYKYEFLTNKYLLESYFEDDLYVYNIYDVTKDAVVYSKKSKEECLFNKTKILYKNDSKLFLYDFSTSEENSIENSKGDVLSFSVSSDNYTLFVQYKDLENIFYIYYL